MFGWFKKQRRESPVASLCRALFEDGGKLLDEKPPKELAHAIAIAALHGGFVASEDDYRTPTTKFIAKNTNRDIFILDRALWMLSAHRHYLVQKDCENEEDVNQVYHESCLFLEELYSRSYSKDSVKSFIRCATGIYGPGTWFRVPINELMNKVMYTYLGREGFDCLPLKAEDIPDGKEHVALYNLVFAANMLQPAIESLEVIRRDFNAKSAPSALQVQSAPSVS
ncbi:hypothetical protein [Nitratidesulfovibrio liaohensis]|uniref:Uncharacterized protein n=1 Tax=Nitratidesulfovibrio liaohensis TaxID=2604158 RepID=A0ABY9R0E5_9BACT|nr:hypothetical protein [Nitratidesulfovibrio liaohensis]WMW65199.1 hypothetical protein KPS_003307 [Nitratidesulfovibrio liaohensis]